MPTLVEKMEADAARRLVLPADRQSPCDLDPYKRFLKVESHRLRMLHRSRGGGVEVCRGRAALMDILTRHLWQAAKTRLSPQAQKEFPPMALVGLGGYGRGELNPLSDIDLMFLHDGQVVAGSRPLPYLSQVMDGILYPLWDMGFKVGYSVRTVSECVQVANRDMHTKTAMLEARLVVGDPRAFDRLENAVLAKCVEGREDDYVAARLADQASRRAKFGNSPTMQEPNIKNGCGGLRDYQNLHWMAWVKYRTRTLAELEGRTMLNSAERKALEKAYDYLLAVRTELHYQQIRLRASTVDVLTKNLQPVVATTFGFTSRDPVQRVQRFMRQLYQHLRNIYLITRLLEERLALLPQRRRLPAIRQLIARRPAAPPEQAIDGFQIRAGQIHAVNRRVFRDKPRRLMRVFLQAQQRGARLHPDLMQWVREELRLVDRSFRSSENVRETFLEILNQRGNVAPAIRAMHEAGLLGKYLPEFGRLTCLVQREFYHQYTADEHTLNCLEQLDRLWAVPNPAFKRYQDIFRQVERPFILYLALLLHDVGKGGQTRGHCEAGGQLAVRFARRLGLDGATGQCLRLLIESHLLMAQISQRRDLEDPAVIRTFATQVQTEENLRMLTLHTVADTLGTSSQLWSGFKDALLSELYRKTMTVLQGGEEFIRAELKQRELLAAEAVRLLPDTVGSEEVQAHFNTLPARYFQVHALRDIVLDITLVHRFITHQLAEENRALEPVVAWQHEPDRGYSIGKVCTWDRTGLFSKIAGSFSAAAINILSAQIFTRLDGIVLDSFLVTDAASGGPVGRESRERFESILFDALTKPNVDLRALMTRLPRARPLYQSLEGEQIPTRIDFDNSVSGNRTLIEVETEDRLGLLHDISKVLSELRIPISLAKIATDMGAAIDSFYVCGPDGQKITSPELQDLIRSRLWETLKPKG